MLPYKLYSAQNATANHQLLKTKTSNQEIEKRKEDKGNHK